MNILVQIIFILWALVVASLVVVLARSKPWSMTPRQYLHYMQEKHKI